MPKISDLSAGAALTGAEVAPVVQGGVTVKATAEQFRAFARTALTDSTVTATGSNQGGAAAVTSDLVRITGGAAGTGIILPAATVGRTITLVNATGSAKYVYPASGEAFFGEAAFTANMGTRMAAGAVAVVSCGAAGYWSSPGLWQAGAATSSGIGGMIQTGDGSSFPTTTLVNPDASSSLSVTNSVLQIGGVGVWHQGNLLSNINTTGGHFFRAAGILVSNIESSSSTYDVAIKIAPSNGAALTSTIRLKPVASAVNNVLVTNAASGSPPSVAAEGTNTDIDLLFTPKGTGNVRFGAHSTLSGESVTGYITIKDAAGNSRKLAVVS